MKAFVLALVTIATLASAQTPRYVPDNEQQLFAFLVGTTWSADAKPEESYVFLENGHFRGERLTPTYTMTGRRTIMMHWNEETNIPCLLNEDCTVMKELAGERHVFVRMH